MSGHFTTNADRDRVIRGRSAAKGTPALFIGDYFPGLVPLRCARWIPENERKSVPLGAAGEPYCPGNVYCVCENGRDEYAQYQLKCALCGESRLSIPGFALSDWIQAAQGNPDGAQRNIDARNGYLPPGYLTYCGASPEMLRQVAKGGSRFCWLTS